MTRRPSLSTRFVPSDVVGYDLWTNQYLLTDGRLMPRELVGMSNKARRARIRKELWTTVPGAVAAEAMVRFDRLKAHGNPQPTPIPHKRKARS